MRGTDASSKKTLMVLSRTQNRPPETVPRVTQETESSVIGPRDLAKTTLEKSIPMKENT